MHRISRVLGALATSTVLLLGAGCSGDKPAAPGGSGQSGQAPLKVVAAFYPFQFLAERVGGQDVQVTSLTQPGAEPHDLELTPKQIASLSQADVVIYQKGFQAAVDKAIAEAKPQHVVDVAQVVTLHPAAAEDEDDHEHETAEPGKTPEADEHDHEHGDGMDPHQWLDPANMVKTAAAVQKEFTSARADRSAVFDTNGAAAQAELSKLDQEFSAGLATCRRKEFITSHAAFSYLAEHYRLTQIAVRGLSPDEEPSPARIAEVQKEATEHGVTTIFYETLVSPEISKSIAGDLHLKTDVLDPLEGITHKSRGKDYLEVQRSNLKALQTANECS